SSSSNAEYFFLQAEGGRRDFHVTGVQTCALPISSTGRTAPSPLHLLGRRHLGLAAALPAVAAAPPLDHVRGRTTGSAAGTHGEPTLPVHAGELPLEQVLARAAGRALGSEIEAERVQPPQYPQVGRSPG